VNKQSSPPARGDGHPIGEIADYLDRRLSLDREREIAEHLSVCAECAADFAYAQGLIDAALRSGETHIRADRLVEITDDLQAEFSVPEWDHFQICPSCQEEAANLQRFPATADLEESIADATAVRAPGSVASERTGRPLTPSEPEWPQDEIDPRSDTEESLASRILGWLFPKGLVWVGSGAAALLLLLMFLPDTNETAPLARIVPISVTVPRSVPDAGSFGERFSRGLEAYVAGNYEAAEVAFAFAREVDSSHVEATLLQGSCQLLQGETDEAVLSLEMASKLADTPEQLAEANWQLANALLLAKNEVRARALLTKISGQEGTHQAAAQEILTALDE
jgi:tetratricopeptide (TPR) repeat protein